MIKPAMLVTVAAVLSLFANGGVNSGPGGGAEEFDQAEIYLEYNATDDDAEVVIIVDAETGLSRLRVTGPTGARIIDLRSRDGNDLGLRKFHIESPEPGLEDVLAAYPAGVYSFEGTTTEGDRLRSEVSLSHELPDAPAITFPLDGAVGVPLLGAVGDWEPVAGAVGYALELEQEVDDAEQKLVANILSDQTSFHFPDNWLFGETESQFGVAAIAANGNVSVTEVSFETAP